ncbi:MAG TPA: zinc ribbon domain-containing protein [Pyrinomonadaceae bacterium]|jgi:predicted nucleic acid-binding Zn ribbon protein|nr:zinc ribbon domain-containing protein [Pyrinomonadaceae bacterium]
MHCPKCGQQQVSDEMRFCSRCGFALGIVTELLVTGGTLPKRGSESFAAKFGGRKRGKRFGLLLMLTSMLLAIIAGIIHDSVMHGPLGAPGLGAKLILFLPAIIIGVAGFVRFLYAWLLEPEVQNAPGNSAMKSALNAEDYVALPVSHSIPAASFGVRRGDTTEMVNPPSVTENTTRLLDQ